MEKGEQLLQDIEIRQCLCGEKLSTECAESQVERKSVNRGRSPRNTPTRQSLIFPKLQEIYRK